jgi:hypothetical protein
MIVVVAQRRLAGELGREGRCLGRDIDRTGGRILAEQRPLRSTQNLDMIEIDEIELRRANPAIIDLIDIDADSVFEAVDRQRDIAAEAADIDVGIARIEAEHLKRGNQLLDLAQRIVAGGLELFGANHAERDRNILRIFFAPARRDQDLAADRLQRSQVGGRWRAVGEGRLRAVGGG